VKTLYDSGARTASPFGTGWALTPQEDGADTVALVGAKKMRVVKMLVPEDKFMNMQKRKLRASASAPADLVQKDFTNVNRTRPVAPPAVLETQKNLQKEIAAKIGFGPIA
jgi:hypothetical protein